MEIRRFTLAGGLVGLVVFVWATLTYARLPALLAMLIAVPLLSLAARRRWLMAPVLLVLLVAIFWTAFGTVAGYFWLNRTRLKALIAEIEAVPGITSLELGVDRPSLRNDGGTGRYDSYRFINGQLVTQYREQVAPHAFQPVLREIDVLRDLSVSPARYGRLRESLEELLLSGFDRRQDGEIALNEPIPGGTPWGTSFVYRPGDGSPSGGNVWDPWQLAPHWFHIWRG